LEPIGICDKVSFNLKFGSGFGGSEEDGGGKKRNTHAYVLDYPQRTHARTG